MITWVTIPTVEGLQPLGLGLGLALTITLVVLDLESWEWATQAHPVYFSPLLSPAC